MRGEPNIVQLVGFVILTSALGVSTAHGQTLSETPIATQNYSTTAAGTNRPLQLAADSPFRDPNIIYLEADSLISDEDESTLTAKGNVEGRQRGKLKPGR